MSLEPPAKFFVNSGLVSSPTDIYNLLRPLLKQTVSYRYFRGQIAGLHGTGWVERIVVDQPEVSTYFTPLSICLNIDSFEHLEFETRPDQLIVYTLVQGDERVVVEFAPVGRTDADEPAQQRLDFDTSGLRPDGAASDARRGRVGSGRWPAEGVRRELAAAVRIGRRQAQESGASSCARRREGGRGRRDGSDRSFFKFGERGTNLATEVRAGLTTFMVMAYIIFLNPATSSPAARPRSGRRRRRHGTHRRDHDDRDGRRRQLPVRAGRRPRHQRDRRLHADGQGPRRGRARWASSSSRASSSRSSSLVGLREAIMNAVPLALKRSIGVGIGLFILFIGFANGGLIVSDCAPDSATLGFCDGTLVTLSFPTTTGQFVFLLGLAITIALYALKIRAALIISILVTTVVALLAGVTTIPTHLFAITPNFSTLGQGLQDPFQVVHQARVADGGPDDLRDHADATSSTRWARSPASPPRPAWPSRTARSRASAGSCSSTAVAAVAGGVGGVSSNTTYIESAAGVAEGGRTGFTSVVTGVLFLLAIFLSPIAGIDPGPGDGAGPRARRLPDVHARSRTSRRRRRGRPAGAADDDPHAADLRHHGRHRRRLHQLGASSRWSGASVGEIHPLMWVVSIAFVVYFAKDWIHDPAIK